eukprot:scaffold7700_cov344-Pinguiococcus_pyrenoidosus.AAC.1
MPLVFCDCPGFLDNRGAEINIANAANVRTAIVKAASVRVIVLISYHSLLADRARGIQDMIKICGDLFGSYENILKHTESLLVGVTKVPCGGRDEEDLESVRDLIMTPPVPE